MYVTDGSAMTSAGNVNPSLTYMALTARAANQAVLDSNEYLKNDQSDEVNIAYRLLNQKYFEIASLLHLVFPYQLVTSILRH